MTREEAIDTVRNIYQTDKEKEALATLIPELAESEDEKFWKYILKACKECVEANDRGLELSMNTTKKLLSWLEKQKDIETKYAGMVVVSQEEWDTAIADAFKHGMDEGKKQKEPKLKEGKYYSSPDCGTTAGVWNEEDDQLIGFIFDILNALVWRKDWAMSKEECLERLKSLRPQPHTVSIKDATKFGNLEYERGVKDGIQYSEDHRWKPSKEQMDALKEASASWMNREMGNSELLESLYNSFKNYYKL